jgi:hypothetical protein
MISRLWFGLGYGTSFDSFFACGALSGCMPAALGLAWFFACAALFGCALTALAFP